LFSIFECLATEHDHRLLLLAAAVCVVSSLTTFYYYSSSRRLRGDRQQRRLIGAGAVCGCGVWATHFIAMLGYCPNLPMAFDPAGTALSLAVVLGGAVAGFVLSANRRASPISGVVVGLSVGAMHYIGVAAIKTVAPISWSPDLVALSIGVAMAGGWAAMGLAARSQSSFRPAAIAGPALLLTGCIWGAHFIGMAAIHAIPDFSSSTRLAAISRGDIALMVGGVVAPILVAALAMIIIESQSQRLSLQTISVAFEGVPCGLALFGADGRLSRWNNAYEATARLLGLNLWRDLSRETMIEQLLANDHLEDPARTRADLASGKPCPGWRALAPNGRAFVCAAHPLSDGGMVSVVQDVTEARATARAIVESRDRAQAANEAKSRFLANISHEVRTPLNGMIGMLQVIAADPLSDIQRERLLVANDAGRSLLAIINDVIDLSKIESGQMTLEPVDFDAGELAQSLVKVWRGAAQMRDLRLNLVIAPEAAGGWRGDCARLRQVLSNLISNAVKFTETGSVTLAVGTNHDHLTFSVADTGVGMDPAQVGRLFESFTQADSSNTRRHGGAGLGLSICRELVTLMDGAITVETRPGAGSTFRLVLPFARVALPVATIADEAPAERSEQALRILAAEDNLVNQRVLRAMLESLGVDLTVVPDGKMAVEAFAMQAFDVVLMDIQMPVMDGVEAARAIRALEARTGRAATPIIAVTANVMPEQIAEYRQVGMDDCVAKPIELETLIGAIDQALSDPSPQVVEAAPLALSA